mgnify:CR=1 FL=1
MPPTDPALEAARRSNGEFGNRPRAIIDAPLDDGAMMSGMNKPTRDVTIVGQGFYTEMSPWAADYAADYNWAGIIRDYNAKLDELAPEGVSWGWHADGPYIVAPYDMDGDDLRAKFRAAVESIDFEAIAKANEYPETERHAPVLTEDDGGMFHITDGRDIWTADMLPGDRSQAEEALAAWSSGQWQPNEEDGWSRSRHVD